MVFIESIAHKKTLNCCYLLNLINIQLKEMEYLHLNLYYSKCLFPKLGLEVKLRKTGGVNSKVSYYYF